VYSLIATRQITTSFLWLVYFGLKRTRCFFWATQRIRRCFQCLWCRQERTLDFSRVLYDKLNVYTRSTAIIGFIARHRKCFSRLSTTHENLLQQRATSYRLLSVTNVASRSWCCAKKSSQWYNGYGVRSDRMLDIAVSSVGLNDIRVCFFLVVMFYILIAYFVSHHTTIYEFCTLCLCFQGAAACRLLRWWRYICLSSDGLDLT